MNNDHKNCNCISVLPFLLVLLLFTLVFSVLGLTLKDILGLHDFGAAFWFFLALVAVLSAGIVIAVG